MLLLRLQFIAARGWLYEEGEGRVEWTLSGSAAVLRACIRKGSPGTQPSRPAAGMPSCA